MEWIATIDIHIFYYAQRTHKRYITFRGGEGFNYNLVGSFNYENINKNN